MHRNLVVALILTLSACTAAEPPATPGEPTESADTSTSTSAAGEALPEGRLAVLAEEGSLLVMRPDGSERNVLSAGNASQPTWSPDGRSLAWTHVDGTQPLIVIGSADGSEATEIKVPFAPFYYSWNPQGDVLAFLGSDDPGMVVIGLVEAAGGDPTVLDGGSSYYFDWSPDGKNLIAHVGSSALAVVDVATFETSFVAESGGGFQTPQWTTEGILHIPFQPEGSLNVRAPGLLAQSQPSRRLQLGGLLTDITVDTIGEVPAFAAFSADTQAQQIAYAFYGDGSEGLRIFDRRTGETALVARGPTPLLQWNPQSDRLAYLAVTTDDAFQLEWRVWSAPGSTDLAPHVPSSLFATSYLPFWDQYNRSMSLWSPDGDRIAYADADGGIYVASVDNPTTAPIRVADGVFVAWSGG